MNRSVLLCGSAALLTLSSQASDLTITSISRADDCTTLVWTSRPGEFYAVQWTDALGPNAFWRVAAALVRSGGTNTSWSNCGGEQGMMSVQQNASSLPATVQTNYSNTLAREDYLIQLLDEARSGFEGGLQGLDTSELDDLESPGGGDTNVIVEARFYRVVRTAVVGTVDGWGSGSGAIPAGLTNAVLVSAGFRHSLALLDNGTLKAWGSNFGGQTNVPTNLTAVVALAAGGVHSIAAKDDGSVVIWGDDSLGQISNAPPSLTNVVDVKAGLWHSMALKSDGTVAAWGDLFNGTNSVPAGLSNVVAIAAGPRDCLALRNDGTVLAWGFSYPFLQNYLATNVPSALSNVMSISAGIEHNEALLRDGSVVIWGQTNNPAVANAPISLTNVLAVSAGWNFGLALNNSATVTAWGDGAMRPPTGLNGVVALSAGASHALVICTNYGGPVIRKEPKDTAAAVGASTNLEVLATSPFSLSYQWQRFLTNCTCWTNLASGTSTSFSFASLQDSDEGLYRVIVSTAAGSVTSRAALVESVHLPVITNQLPNPSLLLRLAPSGATNLAVQIDSRHSGKLAFSWEKDGSGLGMGLGPVYPLADFGPEGEGNYRVMVSNQAGSATSAVWQVSVTAPGQSAGWGDDSYGQSRSFFPSDTNVFVALAAGGLHSLGLREDGTVLAWGYNDHGQTNVPAGLSNVIAIAAGNIHSLALKDNGTVVAWGSNTYNQTNVPASATNIVAIAAGSYHNLGLRRTGTVLGWGDSSYSALNIPSDLTNVMAVSAGDGLSYALLSNGTVRAWGSGGLGAVTVPTNLTGVVQIDAGWTHLLALKADGTVVGLGPDGGWGETVIPAGLSNVIQVSAGYFFSAVLLNDGSLRAWGLDDYGQTDLPDRWGDTKMIAAGGYHCLTLEYDPLLNYLIDPSQDLILICNTNLPDSVAVMNYYRTNRPLVANANVLGIGGATTNAERYVDRETLTNTLITPVLNWLTSTPTKRPTYAILFYGVPATTCSPDCIINPSGGPESSSVSLWRVYPSRKPFITHINMRTPQDCFAYVNKLASFGSNYSPGKIYISPAAMGYGNTNYYFDDARFLDLPLDFAPGLCASNGVMGLGTAASQIFYHACTNCGSDLLNCTNAGGYLSWGYHAGLGTGFPTNGPVSFFGSSGWYLIQTIESFNGQWVPADSQTSFHDYFAATAFGGANYSHTPAGTVTHTDEPGIGFGCPWIGGVASPYFFFGLWQGGRTFGACAWSARGTHSFQAVGDPFVRR